MKSCFPVISLFLFFLGVYFPFQGLGQSSPQALQVYRDVVGANQMLKNGRIYAHQYPTAAGDPFFRGQRFWKGNLTYDGVSYRDLKLGYDVYNQHFVVSLFREGQPSFVILHPQKLQSFDLGSSHFVYIPEGQYPGISEGFYQEIALGVYAKRQKGLVKQYDPITRKQFFFEVRDQYYLVFEGQGTEIRNRKDVKTLVGANSDWKAFKKERKLRFNRKKTSFESDLVQLKEFLSP